MTRVCVAHPKGGVGRSTTVYMLALELARLCPTRAVLLKDYDQGQHLSRMLTLYPPAQQNIYWGTLAEIAYRNAWLTLVDTAPEANPASLRPILNDADWLLVPVKGPEAASVQVLPMFLSWLHGTRCRLLGFVPTMYKARRSEAQRWRNELDALAVTYNSRVFAPIPDLAAIAAWRADGHPYAALAKEILDAVG